MKLLEVNDHDEDVNAYAKGTLSKSGFIHAKAKQILLTNIFRSVLLQHNVVPLSIKSDQNGTPNAKYQGKKCVRYRLEASVNASLRSSEIDKMGSFGIPKSHKYLMKKIQGRYPKKIEQVDLKLCQARMRDEVAKNPKLEGIIDVKLTKGKWTISLSYTDTETEPLPPISDLIRMSFLKFGIVLNSVHKYRNPHYPAPKVKKGYRVVYVATNHGLSKEQAPNAPNNASRDPVIRYASKKAGISNSRPGQVTPETLNQIGQTLQQHLNRHHDYKHYLDVKVIQDSSQSFNIKFTEPFKQDQPDYDDVY